MKTVTKEVYFCSHCNKLYQRKGACIDHEVICSKNPANYRKCLDCCTHLYKKEETQYFDNPFGSTSRVLTMFHCQKIDSFLFPPKVEIRNSYIDLGNFDNQPMKKDCKFYQSLEDAEFNGLK